MGGSAYGDMVECCNNSCDVKWFHLCYMSLTAAPKSIWYCSSRCERSGDHDKQKIKAASSGSQEQGSSRQYRCGSTLHLRISSRDSPLNTKSK